MRIQLFDRGLPQGKKLFADLEVVCKRLQIENEPEYSKDLNKAYARGYQGNTILLIDNEVALIDRYPSQKELENIVNDFLK
ncbi:hypothetical protein KBC75_00145 [Candidatus Shapirobacteria bacterium]|nr:hypothetical protein [Candidatus Shapirobacteria bacterium]